MINIKAIGLNTKYHIEELQAPRTKNLKNHKK